MNNLFDYVLYLFPLAVVIAVALSLNHKHNSEQSELANTSTFAYEQPRISTNTTTPNNNIVNPHKYDMTEPFAQKIPFELTPAAWMQMMNNMMHNMQITQMMHHMASMPNQMMSPQTWMNPHGMLQNGAVNPSQQPMDPEQYKKWYEQQLKLHKSSQ